MSPYTTYDITPISSAGNTADGLALFIMVVVMISLIMGLIGYIINSIFLGMVFKKAGISAGKAWIPVYNYWKTLEIGGQQGFWAIFSLVPVANLVWLIMNYIAIHNINKKIGYDVGMTVLAIFLPLIWVIVAAISKNPWNESLGAPRTDTPDFQTAPPVSQPPVAPQMPPMTAPQPVDPTPPTEQPKE